jgi:HK97 gp10 family phage protein
VSDINKQLNELFRKFKKDRVKIESDIDKIVQANLFEGNKRAKQTVVKDFGKLAQSIGIDKTEKLKGSVIVTMPYAPYVEFGTGTTVEVPSEWRELAMTFKGKGIKQINLPARPFMYPAFQSTKRQFKKDLEHYVKSR